MKKLAVIAALVIAACATKLDLPEEAKEADGIGGATAKVEVAKWLGQVILQLIMNTKVEVKIDGARKEE